MGLFPAGRTKSTVPILPGCVKDQRAGNPDEERHNQYHETLEVLCKADVRCRNAHKGK